MRIFGEIDSAEISHSDIESDLFRRRVLQVGDIDGEGANIAARIILLDDQDHEAPITLWLFSPGGDLYEQFCIYDAMQAVRAPIRTVGMGIAASSAAILLAAGDKGERYITPNAYVMIHQMQVESISGSGTEVAIEAKESKRMNNRMAEILARHTGQPLAKVKRDCEHDHYLDAQGALSYGIVDYVTEPLKHIPSLRRRRKAAKKKEPPVSRRDGEKNSEKESPPNNTA